MFVVYVFPGDGYRQVGAPTKKYKTARSRAEKYIGPLTWDGLWLGTNKHGSQMEIRPQDEADVALAKEWERRQKG